MPKKIVLLHGAKKNIGDFFIFERAFALLKKFKLEHEIIPLEGWKPLDDKLDIINQASAIVIGGGPGIRPNMYPGVYPLTKNLDDVKAPIFTLGSGWKGLPGDDRKVYSYEFQPQTRRLLDKIVKLGVRDYLTMRTLKKDGYKNISMNGCPGWYHLESVGKQFKLPLSKDGIKNIIFTPAQNAIYKSQNIKAMETTRDIFPNANIYCSFQRGTQKDSYTTKSDFKNVQDLISAAEKYNMEIKDSAYDLNKIKFYQDSDLHIGYRLHAHLYFLSHRLPSILFNEDGRGRGLAESIGLPGIDAWARTFFSKNGVKANVWANKNLRNYIEEEISSGWNRFRGLDKIIDGQLEIMKKFIKQIP